MFEKATAKRERSVKHSRRIKVPGKAETYDDKHPVDIARELRAKSKLGQREARLKAMEEKSRRG